MRKVAALPVTLLLRHPVRSALSIGGVVVVVWLALVVANLLAVLADARRGLGVIDRVKANLSAVTVVDPHAADALRAAEEDFEAARAHARSAVFAPLRVLPFVGRQAVALAALASAAEQVSAIGHATVVEASHILEVRGRGDGVPVGRLLALAALAGRAQHSLASVSLGPSGGLLAPLGARRATLRADLSMLESDLGRAQALAGALGVQLAGTGRYLVLAANNAEMRAGSGMFLEAGSLRFDHGGLRLGPMLPTGNLYLPPPGVPMGAQLAARWGWLAPNEEWRNLATTPDFPTTAELAARMWHAATGQSVDGVVALDAEAFSALLSAIGPVEVGGGTVDAANAVRFLTETQYAEADEQARTEQLGALAEAAFGRLEAGRADLARLAEDLAKAAAGRHVLAWSQNPTVEAAYLRAGIGGAVGPSSLSLSVLNGGGDKLDPYLGVRVRLSLTRIDLVIGKKGPSRAGAAGGEAPEPATEVAVSVTLDNTASPTLPAYVLGPVGVLHESPGTYAGLLDVYLPKDALDARILGYQTLVVDGPEGSSLVLAAPFRLPAGHDARFRVVFDLKGRHGSLVIVPSARVPPERWTTPAGAFTDGGEHVVRW